MIIHNQTTHVDGKEINCDSHLTGIPVHITRTNNILSILSLNTENTIPLCLTTKYFTMLLCIIVKQ